jgi:methionine aminopeptidase
MRLNPFSPLVPPFPQAKGVMKPGHIFTIEPMINLGSWQVGPIAAKDAHRVTWEFLL